MAQAMKTDDRICRTLTKAIEAGDYRQIGEIADYLRFRRRANYRQFFELAKSLVGMSEAEWDALLYEADQADHGERE